MRRLLVLPCMFAAAAAFGQDTIYVGVGVGTFSYDETFVSNILGQVSDEVTNRKLFGGFEFNEHFTFEMSYAKTADIRQSGTANVPPFGDVTDVLVMDFTMTALTAVGQLPFNWGALLGGLGYFSSDNGFTDTLTADCCDPSVVSSSISDDGMTALVGIEWRFGRFDTRYGIRLEYQWWDIADADASSVGIAVSYGF